MIVMGMSALSPLHSKQDVNGASPPGFYDEAASSQLRYLLNQNRVSLLRGMLVENRDGQYLGKVSSILIERDTGRARYLVVSSGGFLGMGKRFCAVPAEAISAATAKKGVLALDIDRKRWQQAPLCKLANFVALGTPAEARILSQYYRKTIREPSPALDWLSTSLGDTALPKVPRKVSHLQEAGELIGREIINRRKQSFGEVADLVVDLAGQKPAIALLSPGTDSPTGADFAVPLPLLTSAGEKLLFEGDRDIFERARPLDETLWLFSGSNTRTVVYRVLPPNSSADLRGSGRGSGAVFSSTKPPLFSGTDSMGQVRGNKTAK
jgi:sporulation protein YlmC with PRC-barrel domain